MIKATLVGLAGLLVGREVDRGGIPATLSAPLLLVVSRLPVPALLAAAVGYGLYRHNIEKRPRAAKDISPDRDGANEPRVKSKPARAKPASAKRPRRASGASTEKT